MKFLISALLFSLPLAAISQEGVDSWPSQGPNANTLECKYLYQKTVQAYQRIYLIGQHFYYDGKTVDITLNYQSFAAKTELGKIINLHQDAVDQGCITFVPRETVEQKMSTVDKADNPT